MSWIECLRIVDPVPHNVVPNATILEAVHWIDRIARIYAVWKLLPTIKRLHELNKQQTPSSNNDLWSNQFQQTLLNNLSDKLRKKICFQALKYRTEVVRLREILVERISRFHAGKYIQYD